MKPWRRNERVGAMNGAVGHAYPSRLTAWYTVAIMTLLYVCSFADRTVLTMLVSTIQKDMGAGDFVMSLLLGPAFALFYTLLGLPAGWIADRYSRRILVAVGAVLWGLATMGSGLAANYGQMALARLSIGVGEATLTPAAHSMIADQFPPKRLSLAISVYMLGVTIGNGMALAGVGLLIDGAGAIIRALPFLEGMRPWQVVFFMVAAPTLVLAPLVFTVRDNRPKGGWVHEAAADEAPFRLSAFLSKYWRLLVPYFLGFGITSIAVNALIAWIPTYMGRHFHLPMAQVGLGYGAMTFIATGAGQLLWSVIVDKLYAGGARDIHPRFHIFTWLISAPAIAAAFVMGTPLAFLVLTGLFFFFTFAFQGYANAGLQLVTPPRFRGRMSAAFLAWTMLIGMMVGPTSVGYLTEYVFKDPLKLGVSLTIVVLCCAPLGMLSLWIASRQTLALRAREPAQALDPNLFPPGAEEAAA
ncbi:MAG: hypothetical protein JWP35_1184 [Caulobacter sp.]|nr:hypothetical protein [Caulobacter sp.]